MQKRKNNLLVQDPYEGDVFLSLQFPKTFLTFYYYSLRNCKYILQSSPAHRMCLHLLTQTLDVYLLSSHPGVSNLWALSTYFFKVKIFRTQPCNQSTLSLAAFFLQRQKWVNWVEVTQTIWPTSLKIFTIMLIYKSLQTLDLIPLQHLIYKKCSFGITFITNFSDISIWKNDIVSGQFAFYLSMLK